MNLPELFSVADATHWTRTRRPELLTLFQDEVFGHSPNPPCEVSLSTVDDLTDGSVRRRQFDLLLEIGEARLPAHLLLYQPADAPEAVPAFLMLNFDGNHTVEPDPALRLPASRLRPEAMPAKKFRGGKQHRHPVQAITDAGFALATVCCADFAPDLPEHWREGLVARIPGASWGAIGVWAWGMSRVLDGLEALDDIDPTRVVAAGHSRLGKTALWAAAQDERFAGAFANGSGCTGAALARRCQGERITDINTRFPHWFCKRYKTYNDHEERLPVDQHQLLALLAPRPLYVASASEDAWADPEGEFLGCLAASPAWELFGRKGMTATAQPAVDAPSVGGHIGYHLRKGEHDLTSTDWERVLAFFQGHFRA